MIAVDFFWHKINFIIAGTLRFAKFNGSYFSSSYLYKVKRLLLAVNLMKVFSSEQKLARNSKKDWYSIRFLIFFFQFSFCTIDFQEFFLVLLSDVEKTKEASQ